MASRLADLGVRFLRRRCVLPRALFAACVALALCGAVRAETLQPVPELRARVTDLAGALPRTETSALERKLADFEAKRGAQVAVLIVATTQPETIEQYGIRVFDAWRLGREQHDDGALLLVAVDDRRLRLEVGDGLEGSLTDLVAKRIISDVIAPSFRAGDLAGGIDAGVEAMLRVIEGESLPPPEPQDSPPRFDLSALLPLALLGAAVIAPILRRIFGRGLGALLAGGGGGLLAWLLTRLLPMAFAAALIAFLVTLLGSGRRGWASRRRGGLGGGWSGGFGGGAGGGFRGGGGRASGGGASGSW